MAVDDASEAIRLSPNDAIAYFNRGVNRKALGDLDAAISDYSDAVRLYRAGDKITVYDDSQRVGGDSGRLVDLRAVAYLRRANAWSEKGEPRKSLNDFDEAIRQAPDYSRAYHSRGNVLRDQGDYSKAIADFDQAIRLDPKDAWPYVGRGNTWRIQQNSSRALADFDAAIRLAPDYTFAYLSRGIVRFALRREDAVSDYEQILIRGGWHDENAVYAVIQGHLAATATGDSKKAEQFLNDSRGKLRSGWPGPIAAYLRGELTSQELAAMATTRDRKTEYECYLGLESLLKDKVDQAKSHFEWVAQNGTKIFFEFDIARFELNQLKAAKPAE